IDPGARNFVDRQRRDRRGELERLTESLVRSGRLADGVTKRDALVTLLLLTSFETYCELREAGLADRQVTGYFRASAARELRAPAGGAWTSARPCSPSRGGGGVSAAPASEGRRPTSRSSVVSASTGGAGPTPRSSRTRSRPATSFRAPPRR